MQIQETINTADIIDALDSVTWYQGIGDEVSSWVRIKLDKYGFIQRPSGLNPQMEVIWIMCVVLFGDYGTSPRYGWVDGDNLEVFKAFIKAITHTWREDEDRRVAMDT